MFTPPAEFCAVTVITLSPAGRAKDGSILARLRVCFDKLPACKDLIKRFRADAQGLLECQKILKTKGLSHGTLAQCKPLISEMPSVPLRLEFEAYLEYQLATAKTLGLDHIGLPISSDAIESLFLDGCDQLPVNHDRRRGVAVVGI